MKRGCIFCLIILAASYAGESFLLAREGLEKPWYVPLLLALGIVLTVANFMGVIQVIVRWRASRLSPSEWREGKLLALSGRIQAQEKPIEAPFSGQAAAMYEYQISRTGSEKSSSIACYRGFGMASCVVRTDRSSVKLVGFPILHKIPNRTCAAEEDKFRAAEYLGRTTWTKQSKNIAAAMGQLNEVLSDEDGIVKADFVADTLLSIRKIRDESDSSADEAEELVDEDEIEDPEDLELDSEHRESGAPKSPLEHNRQQLIRYDCELTEQLVLDGQEVTVFGTYHTNPPRLDIGSGIQNLNHGLHLGPLTTVIRNGAIGSSVMTILFAAATAAGHVALYPALIQRLGY